MLRRYRNRRFYYYYYYQSFTSKKAVCLFQWLTLCTCFSVLLIIVGHMVRNAATVSSCLQFTMYTMYNWCSRHSCTPHSVLAKLIREELSFTAFLLTRLHANKHRMFRWRPIIHYSRREQHSYVAESTSHPELYAWKFTDWFVTLWTVVFTKVFNLAVVTLYRSWSNELLNYFGIYIWVSCLMCRTSCCRPILVLHVRYHYLLRYAFCRQILNEVLVLLVGHFTWNYNMLCRIYSDYVMMSSSQEQRKWYHVQ